MNHASEEQQKATRLMFQLYKQAFARHLRHKVFELAEKYCYGCEVNHPSEKLHNFLMWTELKLFDVYKDEAYQCCNDEAIIIWQNAIRSTEILGEVKFALLELLVERQIILKEDHVFKLRIN